jgi:hypothetical protein
MSWNLNDYLSSFRDKDGNGFPSTDTGFVSSFPQSTRITCVDGFSLSVQANHGTYCTPRNNLGPWSSVEVGFPSDTPEFIMEYVEDPEHPTDTVYGYVPIELVEKLIASHGGPNEDAIKATKGID